MYKLEKDLELARLETAFWESCQAVRASSVSLHKIHAFLMQELLDLEADKRRALSQRVVEMAAEAAEMKVSEGGGGAVNEPSTVEILGRRG